ncbi:hypothetical protein GGI15_002175 [Coemansia interrupta]|uniref:L-2-hydroxyglutarate dehydrogenase, mitochondrial n=1 Tax=Coemansia interrupta TaxID=1126814 RepID=A0A9W8HEI4_9FUNG|nr:hypothetical protein GGI15_002175 [Coemansia interrupta]
MYDYCKRNSIPFKKIGKLVVAQNDEQMAYLHRLAMHCSEIGVPSEILSKDATFRMEPNVHSRLALHSPTTGIVDSHLFMESLKKDLLENGADFAPNSEVLAIQHDRSGYRVMISTKDPATPYMCIRASTLVNAAGLWADRITSMLADQTMSDWSNKYRLYFAKGRYYLYVGGSKIKVQRLIYPVPDKHVTSLGTHLTIDMGGAIRFGPDLEWVKSNSDYSFKGSVQSEPSMSDVSAEISRYLPEIKPEDLVPGYTGIRPKLQPPVVENDIEAKPFSLACSVCFWDSREIGWEFEKATGISSQIEHFRDGDPQSKEYTNLLDYWRTVHRISSNNSSGSSSAGLDSHPLAGTSFKHRFGMSALTAPAATTIPEYKAAAYIDTDHAHVSDLMATENGDYISPNMRDPTSKEPKRIRLHMKVSRRCRTCHHILIKPESKAQATRFKIQLIATNYLPKITLPGCLSPKSSTVQPEFPLLAGAVVPVVLRFANPLYSEMKVNVSADFDIRDDEYGDGAVAEVVAQEFVLPPFTEPWEYDEDDDMAASDDDRADDIGNQTPAKQRGIVDRHGNRVAIQVNVMPKAKTNNLIVPLRVVCTHQDDMDLDTDAPASSDSTSAPRIVTSKFWVYISLGPVV